MTLIQFIKYQYHKLTPLEMATRELVVAELALLEDLTSEEAAHASVTYNQTRITRLRKYINAMTEEQEK